MKRKILLVLIMVFLLASCKSKERVYQLGFIGTLSGQYADVGIDEMYGAELAIEEINEAGGINGNQIELVIRDDKADPEIAVEMQNELYEMGIDVVIGHSLSIVASSAVENANNIGMLLLSPSIGTDALSDLDDNLIRIVTTVGYESQYITEKLIEDDPSKVLMLYNLDNLILTQYHRDSFIETMENKGYTSGDYDVIPFESGNDLDSVLIKNALSSGDYDTLIIASSNLDAAGIVNYTVVNDLDIDIHLTSWASSGLLSNIDLTKIENIFAYVNFDGNNASSKFVAFETRYNELYNKETTMLSVNGYDMVYVFKVAVESANSFDMQAIKDAIIEIENFDGINAGFSINQYGDCIREHIQLIIEDGKYVKNN